MEGFLVSSPIIIIDVKIDGANPFWWYFSPNSCNWLPFSIFEYVDLGEQVLVWADMIYHAYIPKGETVVTLKVSDIFHIIDHT